MWWCGKTTICRSFSWGNHGCPICFSMFAVVYRVSCGGCDPKMITRTSRSWDGWFGCKNFVRKKSTTSAFPRESGASRWTEVNGGERRWTEVNGVLRTTQKMLLDVGWSWGFIHVMCVYIYNMHYFSTSIFERWRLITNACGFSAEHGSFPPLTPRKRAKHISKAWPSQLIQQLQLCPVTPSCGGNGRGSPWARQIGGGRPCGVQMDSIRPCWDKWWTLQRHQVFDLTNRTMEYRIY